MSADLLPRIADVRVDGLTQASDHQPVLLPCNKPLKEPRMLPLQDLPDADLASMEGLFLDIDDTLTTDGRLPAHAYAAMERLHDAGLLVVPITGRPAGWCDHIARMWPVDGVVGENGAFYFRHDHEAAQAAPALPGRRRRRAPPIAERLKAGSRHPPAEVPGCALASDQFYRDRRPRHRLLRGRAAAARGRGRTHRRADARSGHDGEGQLDPRQRLVRRLRQAEHDATADAGSVRDRSRQRAASLSVHRRLAERRADVRATSRRR